MEDTKAELQTLGAQITATRAKLAELEAQFDAALARLQGVPAQARGVAPGAQASAPTGSAMTRVRAWLEARPNAPVPAGEVVQAFGDLQPQSVRDALRRLTLDPKSGVTKPSRGEYVWRSAAASASKTKGKAPKTAPRVRGDLAALVREIVRENPAGLPASEIAAAVASRSVRRITNKEVNDQLARLRKAPGESGIDAAGEPRKMVYTPRRAAPPDTAAPNPSPDTGATA